MSRSRVVVDIRDVRRRRGVEAHVVVVWGDVPITAGYSIDPGPVPGVRRRWLTAHPASARGGRPQITEHVAQEVPHDEYVEEFGPRDQLVRGRVGVQKIGRHVG